MKTKYFTLDLKRLDESLLEEPIVTSLLEDDFYKFSMGNFLFDHPEYAQAEMVWKSKNRTKDVLLGNIISERDFMEQYAHVQALQATKTELHYLRGTNEYDVRMFSEGYLEHLANLHIPEATYDVHEGQLIIGTKGPWVHSMHAEMPVIKIKNGLYYRSILKKMSRMQREAVYAEGISRLYKNIERIKQHPNVVFSDFGNRRSFGRMWHEFVVARCAEELGNQFIGTSNVELASKYDLMPIGTCAHELSMGFAALSFDGTKQSLAESFVRMHELWWKKYGHGLSISLPDTFGTDFAHEVLPDSLLRDWKGERIDSRNPMEAIPALIAKYNNVGVDARNKMAIPSDGLSVDTMINVADAFQGKIKVSFGWGTQLTNNMGLQQLSLVMKPYSLDGKYCVKLSDNIQKAIGEPETLTQYKTALGYHETYSEIPTV